MAMVVVYMSISPTGSQLRKLHGTVSDVFTNRYKHFVESFCCLSFLWNVLVYVCLMLSLAEQVMYLLLLCGMLDPVQLFALCCMSCSGHTCCQGGWFGLLISGIFTVYCLPGASSTSWPLVCWKHLVGATLALTAHAVSPSQIST